MYSHNLDKKKNLVKAYFDTCEAIIVHTNNFMLHRNIYVFRPTVYDNGISNASMHGKKLMR